MKRKQGFVALMAGSVLAVSLSVAAADVSVENVLQRYVDSIQHYDQAQLEQVLAGDYIEVSPVGEVDERKKMIGFYDANTKAQMAGRSPAITMSEIQTRNYGDIAISIVKLQFDIKTPDGNTQSRAIRATFVSKKAGNGWQIISSQFTGIKPAPVK